MVVFRLARGDFLILPTTVFFFAVNGGAWLLVEDNKILRASQL